MDAPLRNAGDMIKKRPCREHVEIACITAVEIISGAEVLLTSIRGKTWQDRLGGHSQASAGGRDFRWSSAGHPGAFETNNNGNRVLAEMLGHLEHEAVAVIVRPERVQDGR